MAKKLIPRNMRKSLKKTIIKKGGETAESKHKGKQEVRSSIRKQVNTGEMKRKTVTWNFHIGDLVKIKNHKNKLKVGVVLKKIKRTNHYANEDREYITVMTPDNNSYEVSPKKLVVIQRMS